MSIKKILKQYQVKSVGQSYKQQLPINHMLVIRGCYVRGNDADDGYELILFVETYTDNTHDIKVQNDLIPDDQIIIALGATLPANVIETLSKNEMVKWLDKQETIGTSKWIEIS